MSESGTKRTSMGCQSMSAFGDKADNKCSGRAFPLLTLIDIPFGETSTAYSLPISIRLIIFLTAASAWQVLGLDIAGPGHPETGV